MLGRFLCILFYDEDDWVAVWELLLTFGIKWRLQVQKKDVFNLVQKVVFGGEGM